MASDDILRRLIAFPTVSADPNRALIDYCAGLLQDAGAEITVIEDDTGSKANLYATIGPKDRPGVLLSGHTDVVPIEGQAWTVPAFEMTEKDGKLFGRGSADMKGFVACAMNAALIASKRKLLTPLHIALSYDEEIGCVGVRSLIDMLSQAPFRPLFCIVGEPTQMAVATGHKGKTAGRVTCVGREGHSALAPMALNAIHLAVDMVSEFRALQDEVQSTGPTDGDYDVPYTTLHVGRIEGGIALNIVPRTCWFDFEIRNLSEDDPTELLRRMTAAADTMLASVRPQFPEAEIRVEVTNRYPPLATAHDAEVVSFVKSLTGTNSTMKVAFGTEGGLFDTALGVPTVVCGPGSMAQGHKPDEFITRAQLEACDAMLGRLVQRLQDGVV
jgi:acetylornithine deacetylase